LELVLTDLERPSLEIAAENLKLNGAKNASTLFYSWGPEPIPGKTFDLVIGSDVIYGNNTAPVIVAQAIGALLSQEGTAIVANDLIRFA
jgi:16S rRNA G1207 methylase RsmC